MITSLELKTLRVTSNSRRNNSNFQAKATCDGHVKSENVRYPIEVANDETITVRCDEGFMLLRCLIFSFYDV